MAKVKLSEFNTYLNEQVGQPYIWGAQHLKLTESDYISIITRKESDPTYRASAIAFCKKLFDSGATVLYAIVPKDPTLRYCRYDGSRASTSLKPGKIDGWVVLDGLGGNPAYRVEKDESGEIILVPIEPIES